PTGFKAAWDEMAQGGWMGLDASTEFGGQGMPHLINTATGELFSSANMAFQMYVGLSHGAASALAVHGSEEQKQTYLPPIYEGRWSGTMNLTEPHCGTDLGLMRTKAELQADGSYKISGQKIWISGGENDLVENIVHLVLAKTPDAPDGIKGVSLFVVPKFLVNEDGSLGDRNDLSCGGLEEKMGIHGNATCVMNYDGATGWLVGDLHKGMRAMFTMMNEARLAVALQGYTQGEVAYQNALGFAKDRLQGRDVTGVKNPNGPADPIIVHPDVRRNLMDQKSMTEGGRALVYWGAQMIDRSQRLNDQDAEEMISLLIPVLKGFLTDKGFETTVLAQQTLGGSGFTREWGLEQFVRDARIAMIYEGTNGIQSLDLVGRKLPANGGKGIMAFFEMVKTFIKENEGNEALKEGFLDPLKAASKDLQSAGMYFMQEGMKNPLNALSGSYDFMHLFGHTVVGLMWAQMAKAAMEALDAGASDAEFYETKIATGRYYMARQLPMTATHLARIQSGADPVMALDAANF
ncbi:MAG: acyl-CoA dehydrogenase C-terminal domain-containing protein, partial [Pseudomonadota bacterium]